ncbi:TDP-N-acetylfucosamine:lipid II N-acetylfucosaminyltransferase [Aureispira sp. CCB-QB1]|uniref:TDP-N-acetylfucosamine:lipid II N-acetylfucosaminyltransferase n=1 Tax=Aureispira sp. CCB-QB1 TaxID=1313421 RepID=UPI0006963127|nr:TDP-N-acetylfucosamine:lipid II N-acetylfucosaminyltransferase [Aureispira sp. CCB-QB1]
MKILLAGHISFNLIAPYTRRVKQILPMSEIGVLGLNRPGTQIRDEDKIVFDEVIEKPTWTKKKLYKVLFSYNFIKHCLSFFIKQKNVFNYKIYLNLKQTIINLANEVLNDEFYKNTFQRFDIINFQYIDRTSTKYLQYLNANNKVVLTFWGSDLMCTAGVELYEEQLRLIDRADRLVVHSLQMREILLSKYGRKYLDKVRLNYFGLEDIKFNKISKAEADKKGLKEYAQKWQIPENKIKLLIGYSGAKSTRHHRILEELNKKSEEWRDKFHLVIPMTYNNNDKEYFKAIENLINKTEYSSTHIVEYLTDDEVAYLYNLIDVFINIRESDAFNATMVETLYLNKINIVGSWLPYEMIKRSGINYLEVEKISDINKALYQVLVGDLNPNIRHNKEKIYKLTSNNYTVPKWCDIYKELYQL